MDNRTRWEHAADDLYAPPRYPSEDVYFGPWAPGDSTLGVLGAVEGRRVLDLGCGGGENAVALARAGAQVTGLDISGRQLARGARLASHLHATVAWRCADMEQADAWKDLVFDLILAAYVLPYCADPVGLLQRCRDALAPGGRLVMSLDHPLRSCFWDDEAEETVAFPVRGYGDARPLRWRINDIPVAYAHRTTAAWLDLVVQAGLRLERLVEPMADAATIAEWWPEDSGLSPLAHIPHTLIVVAARIDEPAQ